MQVTRREIKPTREAEEAAGEQTGQTTTDQCSSLIKDRCGQRKGDKGMKQGCEWAGPTGEQRGNHDDKTKQMLRVWTENDSQWTDSSIRFVLSTLTVTTRREIIKMNHQKFFSQCLRSKTQISQRTAEEKRKEFQESDMFLKTTKWILSLAVNAPSAPPAETRQRGWKDGKRSPALSSEHKEAAVSCVTNISSSSFWPKHRFHF